MGELACYILGLPWGKIIAVNAIGGILVVIFLRNCRDVPDKDL
jgi:hypothetical protein